MMVLLGHHGQLAMDWFSQHMVCLGVAALNGVDGKTCSREFHNDNKDYHSLFSLA